MATTRSEARFDSMENTLQDLLAVEECRRVAETTLEERRLSAEAANDERRRRDEEERTTMREDMWELKQLTELLKGKAHDSAAAASPSSRCPELGVGLTEGSRHPEQGAGQAVVAEGLGDWRDEDARPPAEAVWSPQHEVRAAAGYRRAATNPNGPPAASGWRPGRREPYPEEGRQGTEADRDPQGEWGGITMGEQRAWCRRVELPVFDESDPLG